MTLRVGVTGAQGYVGAAIARALDDAGHDVVALTRGPGDRYIPRAYDLARPIAAGLLADVDVVIHSAYDFSVSGWGEIARVNVDETRRLLDASVAAGAGFVLVSSASAYPATPQLYGRAKLAAEGLTLASGGNVVRLGTVYGGANGGLFGALRRASKLPVLPVFAADSRQSLVHVDDVAAACIALTTATSVSRRLAGLAHPSTVSLRDLMQALSAADRRPARIVPVPWRPIHLALRACERLGLRLPVQSETILGLARPAPALAGVELWDELGVGLRELHLPSGDWS